MTIENKDHLARRRLRDVEHRSERLSPIAVGSASYFRPAELLLTLRAVERYGERLSTEYGARPYRPGDAEWRLAEYGEDKADLNGRFVRAGIPVQLWTVPTGVDLPQLVDGLRRKDPEGPAIGLNQVLFGEPVYKGGPGDEPVPDEPCVEFEPSGAYDRRSPDLAVLDTGLPTDLASWHPELVGVVRPDADDRDALDDDGDGLLDTEAGHATFIIGLVHRVAPALVVDPGRVLDSTGVGDDATVCLELAETRAPVVNLSLGGYTEDDRPPIALGAAIAALGRSVAVVAAAGNFADDRPFYPAALKGVVAVGAFDSCDGAQVPADFTNHGAWVDVCAPGVMLRSSYVKGTWRASDGARVFERGARWSGTSFAAPLVAAEIARRHVLAGGSRTARQAADDLLAELPDSPWPQLGRLYEPAVDLTR